MSSGVPYNFSGIRSYQKLTKTHYLLMAKQLLDDDKDLENEIEFKQALIESKGDREKAKYVFCELYYKKAKKILFWDHEIDIFKEITYEIGHRRYPKGHLGIRGYGFNPKYNNNKNIFCEQLKRIAKDNPDTSYSTWGHFKNVVESGLGIDPLSWDAGDNLVYFSNELGNKKLYSGWYIDYHSIFYIRLGVIIIMITEGYYEQNPWEAIDGDVDRNTLDMSEKKKIPKKEKMDKIDEIYQNIYYLRLSEDTYCELKYYPPNTDGVCFLGSGKTYLYDHEDEGHYNSGISLKELKFYRDGNIADYREMLNNREIGKQIIFYHPSWFKNDDPYAPKDMVFYKYVYEYSGKKLTKKAMEYFYRRKSDKSDSYLYFSRKYNKHKIYKKTQFDEDGNKLTILRRFINWIEF